MIVQLPKNQKKLHRLPPAQHIMAMDRAIPVTMALANMEHNHIAITMDITNGNTTVRVMAMRIVSGAATVAVAITDTNSFVQL